MKNINIDEKKLASILRGSISDMKKNPFCKEEVVVGEIDGLIATISVYSRSEAENDGLEYSDLHDCITRKNNEN